MSCQARHMDRVYFESPNPVPECDQAARVEIEGYRLCAGCAQALSFMTGLGEKAIVLLGDLVLRQAAGESEDEQRGRRYTLPL